MEETLRLLRENRDKLDGNVEALMEHETLNEQQAYAAAGVTQKPARPPMVGAAPGSPGREEEHKVIDHED